MKRLLSVAIPVILWLGICSCEAEQSFPAERLHSTQARNHGKALFQKHCVLCHGKRADGKAAQKSGRILLLRGHPPDFNNPVWRKKVSALKVFKAIRDGVRGTSMRGWDSLNDEEKWDLTAYILSIHEQGP